MKSFQKLLFVLRSMVVVPKPPKSSKKPDVSKHDPGAVQSTLSTEEETNSGRIRSNSTSCCGTFTLFSFICNTFGCLRIRTNPKTGATVINIKGYVVYLLLLLSFLYVVPLFLCNAPNIYQHSLLSAASKQYAHGHQGDFASQLKNQPKLLTDLIPTPFEIQNTANGILHTVGSITRATIHYTATTAGTIRQLVVPDWIFHAIDHTLDDLLTKQTRGSFASKVISNTKTFVQSVQQYTSVQYLSKVFSPHASTTTAGKGGDFSSFTPHGEENLSPLARMQPATCTAIYSTRDRIYVILHVTLNTILQGASIAARHVLPYIPSPPPSVILSNQGSSASQETVTNLVLKTVYGGVSRLTSALKRLSQYETKGLTSAAQFIKGIIVTSTFVEKPSWSLHRIGKPIASFLTNVLALILPPQEKVMMLAMSFLQTSILRASCSLHVPDAIEWYETGILYNKPTTAAELGLTTDLFYRLDHGDAYQRDEPIAGIHLSDLAKLTCTHEESLERLLRAASVMGVFAEVQPKRWTNTRVASLLVSTAPDSLHAAVMMSGNEQFIAQANLEYSVRYGRSGFTTTFGDFWDYHKLSKDQELILHNTGDDRNSTGQTDPKYRQIIGKCSERIDLPITTNTGDIDAATQTLPFTKNKIPIESLSTTSTGKAGQDKEKKEVSTPQTATNKKDDTTESKDVKNDVIVLNPVRLPVANAYGEFNQGMTSIATTVLDYITSDTHLFNGVDTLVDISGGKGHLLAAILKSQEKTARSTSLLNTISKTLTTGSSSSSSGSGSNTQQIQTGVLFDLSYTFDNPTTMQEVTDLMTNALYLKQQTADGTTTCQTRAPLRLEVQGKNEKQQQQQQNGTNGTEAAFNSIILSFQQRTSIQLQTSKVSNLCKAIYVHTGSFFERDTMPLSIDYNRDAITHKLRAEYEKTYDIISRNVDAYDTEHTGESISLPKTAVYHQTTYMMMQILHDWSDDDSIRILKSIYHALTTTTVAKVNGGAADKTTTQPIDELDQILCFNADGSLKVFTTDAIEKSYGETETDFAFKTTVQLYCTEQQHYRANVNPTTNQKSQTFQLAHHKKLYIIDRLILDESSNIVDSYGSNYADILMLNNFNNAKERTISQFEHILNQSGFVMTKVIPTRFMYVVVEAVPIPGAL